MLIKFQVKQQFLRLKQKVMRKTLVIYCAWTGKTENIPFDALLPSHSSTKLLAGQPSIYVALVASQSRLVHFLTQITLWTRLQLWKFLKVNPFQCLRILLNHLRHVISIQYYLKYTDFFIYSTAFFCPSPLYLPLHCYSVPSKFCCKTKNHVYYSFRDFTFSEVLYNFGLVDTLMQTIMLCLPGFNTNSS